MFVRFRSTSKTEQLHHVLRVLNPADDCSHGLTAAESIAYTRHLYGPEFLYLPKEDERWPEAVKLEEPTLEDLEVKLPRWIGVLHREQYALSTNSSACCSSSYVLRET